jgi:uncharacterized protein YndB with AHSA1/START domain
MSPATDQVNLERSAVHATFVIERTYPTSPERVFAAWSDAQAKRCWFGPPELPVGGYSLDFRVGGSEHMSIGMPDGGSYTLDATYQDIVEGERILYSYDMHHNGARISVSLATIEFRPGEGGTQLTLTEQGVFLDGLDTNEQREHGTIELMKALGAHLENTEAGA